MTRAELPRLTDDLVNCRGREMIANGAREPGRSRARLSRITASAAWSAAVTGEWSAFMRGMRAAGAMAKMAAAARATRCVARDERSSGRLF